MNNKDLHHKIKEGVQLAVSRMIEHKKSIDGDLVYSINGKIVKIKARDLKYNNH
ncbi:MAG: hypothetical protein U0U66_01925 [Cytophagaceae bacterium]